MSNWILNAIAPLAVGAIAGLMAGLAFAGALTPHPGTVPVPPAARGPSSACTLYVSPATFICGARVWQDIGPITPGAAVPAR